MHVCMMYVCMYVHYVCMYVCTHVCMYDVCMCQSFKALKLNCKLAIHFNTHFYCAYWEFNNVCTRSLFAEMIPFAVNDDLHCGK